MQPAAMHDAPPVAGKQQGAALVLSTVCPDRL